MVVELKNEDGTDKTPEQVAVEEANAKVTAAEAKVAEVMKVLTSPEYADFLATKANPKGGGNGKGKETITDADRAKFEEKLSGMSRAEFAAFIRDAVKTEVIAEVKEVYFTPLAQAVTSERTRQEVEAAVKEFPDFFDYREEMTKLAESNPSLNAKQVYHLAKANKPVGQKPPLRKAGGEVPGGSRTATPKKETNLTAAEAIEKAFDIVGL